MKIIEPYVELESEINGEDILKTIEKVGRVCYKSEDRTTEESAKRFVESLMKRGHESVIEHVSLSVRVVCDRGVTHEIVRHRVASYAQESTRYCNYGKDKFDNELTFINPCFWTGDEDKDKKDIWINTMKNIEKQYLELLKIGATPEEARSILPNSLKTEIIITMNLREWRHFFKLRTSNAAHPQMRQVAFMILEIFKEKVPVIFDDIII